jgi:hypothetical protein
MTFTSKRAGPDWDRGARVRQAHEAADYRPGKTLGPDYNRFRNLPVEGAGEDIRAGIKAAVWGIAAALFVVLFLVVRH